MLKNDQRESSLANLKELLSYKFIIPLFQRPYSWDSDHFKDLLETIKENKQKERDAFLGSIIVALKKIQGSSVPGQQEYFLIDGQQRITSFLLLLKFISNKLESLIEEKDKDIKEKITLLDDAKKKKDVNLVEKYIHQQRDEISKKEKYGEYLKNIKQKLVQDRIGRESQTFKDLEQDILKYIFSNESGSQKREIIKIKNTFEQETEDIDNIIDFLDYVLNKCIFCFLTIEGDDSEDYAIDIFNSLNSTGEPLTAFEILKSLIYKKFETNKDLQKKLTDSFNNIEKDLNRKKMKKVAQNKYTDRLLLFINMIIKNLQLPRTSTFRDKRKILDRILDLPNDQIKQCIQTMHSLHSFILNNWENKDTPLKEYKNLTDQNKVVFNFFQSDKHDRVLPILYYFRKLDLSSAIEVCAAFTCLWRGYSSDGKTDRIDNQYEEVIKETFQKESNIQDLKKNIRKFIKVRAKNKKLILTREKWIDKFKTIDIYKSKRLARFLLNIAFDKRDFNEETQSLNKSKLRFLDTMDKWLNEKYKTIEHITPQDHKIIDKIGNLILLPQDINNKAGKKNFIEKKSIYQKCLKTEPNDMPYIPVLKEIVSYGQTDDLDNNFYLKEEIINVRGEKLGDSIWQTLAEDWLGWKK